MTIDRLSHLVIGSKLVPDKVFYLMVPPWLTIAMRYLLNQKPKVR